MSKLCGRPTSASRELRRQLGIAERRPRETKIQNKWVLSIGELDLVICDCLGSVSDDRYLDELTGIEATWGDHCWRACTIAEDAIEMTRRRHVLLTCRDLRRAAQPIDGPIPIKRLPSGVVAYPAELPLDGKVAFLQPDGALCLASRTWSGPTAGVYMLRHQVEGSVYIGQATNIVSRWLAHQAALKHGQHVNHHLQAAWDSAGVYGLEWIVLESVPDVYQRDQAERDWIACARRDAIVFNIA